ncbi:hypothetical protein [Parvularcula lutaonensis]|uniref:VPLPA-CTERM sorting domain-containing protein n=1 Tax=Parvularcula lutaonensis TaxID=491923 RepID=A0ABV7MA70_9PROT|nr:hypothetical protein [Parvularcula lutaonensis]GGY44127.1 hypothetical protein GCM10007148_11280 [Parvularcula lutaonensis]
MGAALFATANAAAIKNGETTVTVVFDVEDNNLTAKAVEGAKVSFAGNGQPVYEFRITGGTLNDDLSGTIEHSGGARLEASGDPSTFIELTNFTFDLGAGEVYGDVEDSLGTDVTQALLFNFTPTTRSPVSDPFDAINDLPLIINFDSVAIAALTDLLGSTEFMTGDAFATAATDPSAVPIPAGAILFAPVAAGLWARSRKRKQAA